MLDHLAATQRAPEPEHPTIVVEPMELMRSVLCELAQAAGCRVVASAADVASLPPCESEHPDLALVGVSDEASCADIRALMTRFADVRVLAVGPDESSNLVVEILRAGARGFLPRAAEINDVGDAIQRVAKGEEVVHPDASTATILWLAGQEPVEQRVVELTPRQREIISMLTNGKTTPEIARELFLSRRTVESHLANIYRKMKVRNRFEAIRAYRRLVEVT